MQRLLSFVLVMFLACASHADMAYEKVTLTVSQSDPVFAAKACEVLGSLQYALERHYK